MVGASEWSSLEVVKVALAALTPILLFALGLVVSRASRRVEEAQWASRKLIETRLSLYEQMAPKLNDLYCFFTHVGDFRRVTPPEAVARKRELDGIFYSYAPLFSQEFRDRYESFMEAYFETYTGYGQDAKLRTPVTRQRKERKTWDASWDRMFSDRHVPSQEDVKRAYGDLMACFAEQVGATAH
jgi:hypothetical protein